MLSWLALAVVLSMSPAPPGPVAGSPAPAGPIAGSGQTVQVIPLAKDGEVYVSFKLEETLPDEIRAAIHSGVTLKLVYKVDLGRSSAVWLDRTIATAVVSATVRYD